MNKIIFSSTIIVTIIIIIFTILISQEMDQILTNNEKIEKAIDLSIIALDFNVENFHTQLEVWEYAYLPNSERLDAFYIHQATLMSLLEKWQKQIDKAKNTEIIYENGIEDMNSISNSLKLVKNDWVEVIKVVRDYEKAVLKNASQEEIMRLDKIAKEKVVENEFLFDDLKFNKKTDTFVIKQKSMINELQEQQEQSINDFKFKMIVFLPIAIIVSLIVNFIIIKKMK